jgi:hypothetical protein
MRREYAYREWAPLLSEARIAEALRLSPALAVLIYALYGANETAFLESNRVDRVKRSLVRRLYREIEALRGAGAL